VTAFAAERPGSQYSYVYDTRYPDKLVCCTARCDIDGCGWSSTHTTRGRALRAAKTHRTAHRQSILGGPQLTIFDALREERS